MERFMSWDLSSEEVICEKLENQQRTIFAFSKKIKELETKVSILIGALELIAGEQEFFDEISDRSKTMMARETLKEIGVDK
jgi:hypothetical protein